MANQAFTLFTNTSVGNSLVTGNGAFTVHTSSTVSNNNSIGGIRLVVTYASPNPSAINITAVIESEQAGSWYPIAYQFNPFNDLGNGPQRIIIMHPSLSSADAGIDDDIYVGDTVIARVSRQQGKVGSNFRVRFVVFENNHGTANAFQNVTISAYGELFD